MLIRPSKRSECADFCTKFINRDDGINLDNDVDLVLLF